METLLEKEKNNKSSSTGQQKKNISTSKCEYNLIHWYKHVREQNLELLNI
jgi:hypothetical protein